MPVKHGFSTKKQNHMPEKKTAQKVIESGSDFSQE
jgi:hypothetical protein